MALQKNAFRLCALYKQESGKQLTEVYSGTIGQSLAQYKAGSGVSVFVSDRQTLEDSDVSFASFQPLGTAVLVLAWKKGLNVESPQDLQNPKIQSIGYPDKKGAIYGKAAERFLTQSGLRGPLKDKLRMFSTVPQVFSYLTTANWTPGSSIRRSSRRRASPSEALWTSSPVTIPSKWSRRWSKARIRTPKSRRF